MKSAIKHAAFSVLGSLAGAHRSALDLHSFRRFFLLEYSTALGSVVHATPIVPALRTAMPDAEITVLGSGFATEIFRGNPGVDRLVETPNPTQDLRAAVAALKQALPAAGTYAVLTPLSNERSAIGLAATLAGARTLVGFTLVPELFRTAFTFDPALSQIRNNLRIVEAFGHAPTHFEPEVFPAEADFAHARSLLARFADPDPTRPVAVLVTQTSVTQRKSWRTERFAAAAHHLQQRGFNVLLVGSAGERPGVESVAAAIGPAALNVAGETNLPQLAALLSLCRVGLTLDTGTLHLGRAVSLPMVVVAPAWSPPLEWLPLDDPRYLILKNLDMPSAPPDYIIDEVSVPEVTAALDTLLALPDRRGPR